MRNIFLMLFAGMLIASCSNSNSESTQVFGRYGDSSFTAEDAIELASLLELMDSKDTINNIKVKGTVSAACQAKGCWMTMDMPADKELVVTFKEYGFFVPKNSAEHMAIMSGMAFKEITPVTELQEHARDANKSEEEIAAITEPKVSYKFVADGVILE